MRIETFRALYDYNAWADHRLLDACAALSHEQFTRDLGAGFPSVRDTLVHILDGEWFWLERWQGRSPAGLPPANRFSDLAGIRARWSEVEGELLRFVAGRTAEDLARVQHYRTTEGNPNSQPLWQMLQHLANHGSYHRGQAAAMLRQVGAAPVATDLILYYRERGGLPPDAAIEPGTIRLLYDYNAWANHRTVAACAALGEERFTSDLGSSFRSVRDTLVHILGVEWLYLERFRGRSPAELLPGEHFPDLARVCARWPEIETELLQFVAAAGAEDLARVQEYRTTKGAPVSNPLWQSLQHLVNHSTYHRGQVAMLLRQLGAQPNFTDLIYFYRERAGQPWD